MSHLISRLSVTPSCIVHYMAYEGSQFAKSKNHNLAPIPIDNKHHGLVSKKANKRLKNAIDWMIHLSVDKGLTTKGKKNGTKFKLNFVTLTLSSPQIHSDGEIKAKLLNQFLIELKQKWNCSRYVWRAESQQNGRIHFHVVTDVFIPWRELRTAWNRIQDKLGYIERYTERSGKIDPNSTDVHRIKEVKNLGSYLSKYCGKNSKGITILQTKSCDSFLKYERVLTFEFTPLPKSPNFFRQIHGRLWSLSAGLSKFKKANVYLTDKMQAELEFLFKIKSKACIEAKHCLLYLFDQKELIKRKCFELARIIPEYVQNVFFPKPIPPKPFVSPFTKITLVKEIEPQFQLDFA